MDTTVGTTGLFWKETHRDYINILHIYYLFMFMRLYTLCISAFVIMV